MKALACGGLMEVQLRNLGHLALYIFIMQEIMLCVLFLATD